MADYSASDLRKGLKIELDGEPYVISEFQFVKPGKGAAMYKSRVKSLITGYSFEKTFREVDTIGKPDLMAVDSVFSYESGDDFVFSDVKTFEEYTVTRQQLDRNAFFLQENMAVSILFFNGKPIEVTLPIFVELVIGDTEPGFRGDSTNNVMKPAKTENGYELKVPLFINVGDRIRVDTRTGEYSDRVGKS
jgi:elongation factor P